MTQVAEDGGDDANLGTTSFGMRTEKQMEPNANDVMLTLMCVQHQLSTRAVIITISNQYCSQIIVYLL